MKHSKRFSLGYWNMLMFALLVSMSSCLGKSESGRIAFVQETYKATSVFTIPDTHGKYIVTKACGEVLYVDVSGALDTTLETTVILTCRDGSTTVKTANEVLPTATPAPQTKN